MQKSSTGNYIQAHVLTTSVPCDHKVEISCTPHITITVKIANKVKNAGVQ